MCIKMIHVFEFAPPAPDMRTACLLISDSINKLVEVEFQRDEEGFFAKLKLGVNCCADVHAHIENWIQNLDFHQANIVLAIFSNSSSVSSMDAACLAHLVVPDIALVPNAENRITPFLPLQYFAAGVGHG